ncbi:unnamed protein product, partial [marine sediment metagenome]
MIEEQIIKLKQRHNELIKIMNLPHYGEERRAAMKEF